MNFTGQAKSLFKEIFGNGAFAEIADILMFNPSTSLTTAWAIIGKIYDNVMVPIALGLMIIWFLVAFMEKTTHEQVTFEQLLLLFAKLIAAKFLIDHGLEIFTKLWSIGISLVEDVSSQFSASESAGIDIKAMWKSFTGKDWDKKLKLVTSIAVWFKLLLPWIVSKVQIGCVYFICYSRLLEMMWRICGAPIAVSDFMSEGLNGAGWRYLKNFLAICLQGAIILVISKLYSFVMYDIFVSPPGGAWTVILMQLAVSFAAIALMFKSLSLAKELVGTA